MPGKLASRCHFACRRRTVTALWAKCILIQSARLKKTVLAPLFEVLTWYRTVWEGFVLHALDVSAFLCGNHSFFICAFWSAFAHGVRRAQTGGGIARRTPREKRSAASFLNRAPHGSSRRRLARAASCAGRKARAKPTVTSRSAKAQSPRPSPAFPAFRALPGLRARCGRHRASWKTAPGCLRRSAEKPFL